MHLPCENFVNQYLPSVRARIVKVLYEKYKLDQTKIANILGITQPAVSQYLKNVRGKGKKLPENLIKYIDEKVDEIYSEFIKGNLSDKKLQKIFCDICKRIQVI